MKQYRVVGKGRHGYNVVILDGASKQVAKATARGCTAFSDAKVQTRTVTEWKDA